MHESSFPAHSILRFKVLESEIREQIRGWCADQILAPNDFKRRAALDNVRGAYVPYWSFNASVYCPWEAQIGYFTGKDTTSRSPRKRSVDWEPASGVVEQVLEDVLIPAATGVRPDLLAGLEPWPVKEFVGYDPGFLSGFVVEHHETAPLEAAPGARKDMDRLIRNICELQTPGDTCRFVKTDPQYSKETFKLVLLPIWLMSYTYRGRTFQVVVNGRTGKIAGDTPTSFWKSGVISLVVLAVFLWTFMKLLGLYRAMR